MYCKNCGAQIQPGNPTCLTCGANVGDGNAYCANCGYAVKPGAAVCTNCGFAVNAQTTAASTNNCLNGQDKVLMIVLTLLVGHLGIHHFMLGEVKKGITKILLAYVGSVMTCGIAAVVVLVLLIVEAVKMYKGTYVVDPTKFF